MRSLDMQAVKEHKIIFENITTWPALRFEPAYEALVSVLAKAPRVGPSSDGTCRQEQTQDPQKTPPNQSTVPANPNYSGSTASSSDSKAETFTDRFVDRFVESTIYSLREITRNMPWLASHRGFYLSPTLLPPSLLY
jgi:hypothetical protein